LLQIKTAPLLLVPAEQTEIAEQAAKHLRGSQ
jgi:hypothetical protein